MVNETNSTISAALRLEAMGRDGIMGSAGEAFSELEKEIERLNPALAARIQS